MARNSIGKARLRRAAVGSWLLAVSTLGAPTVAALESGALTPGIIPAAYRLAIEPDPANSHFQARILIEFDVLEPSREVVVDSAGLEVAAARRDGIEDASVIHDKERQRLTFVFAEPLSVGRHQILVRYRGSIGDGAPGLYRIVNEDGAGTDALYSAMCCFKQARFLAPIWDEGNFKTIFELELVLEKNADAVSVMPVARREILPDERVRVTFQPTPAMTPRLFFFAAGHFERLSRRHNGTELSMVVPHGKAAKTGYALAATEQALDYLASYLRVPYPLPKLDSVVLPGAAGGAIASWGSIQYAERYLTVGPDWSSPEELLITSAIIAHEVAHQWFANLVTPAGLSHLWLGEGFAVWLENNAIEARYSGWNYWLRATEYREAAMYLDARETHAIARPPAIDDAIPRSNEIIYDKSAQVLRMMEEHAGANGFQMAVRAFVGGNAYDNVTTDDLWRTLEDSSLAAIADIGRDFTGQSGLPLIEVLETRCVDGMTIVRLRQSRFGAYADSRKRRSWRVPVTAMIAGQQDVRSRIVSGDGVQELELDGCGVAKVNVGNVGYFRTLYDEESFRAISTEVARLSAAERLGLLNDEYMLAEAGYTSFTRYLDLVSRLPADSDPLVHLQWVRALEAFDLYYVEHDARQAFREFARSRLAPLLERVGWDAREGESVNVPALRSALIETTGRLEHVDTQLEARRRYEAANGDLLQLPADSREAIAVAIGSAADRDTADELYRRAAAAEDVQNRQLYWLGLSAAQEPGVADDVLDRMLADSEIEGDLLKEFLATLATSHPARVYHVLESHADAVAGRLGAGGFLALLSDVADNSTDREIAERLVSFAAGFPADQGAVARRAASEILYRDEVRRKRLPEAGLWTKLNRNGGLTGL